MLDQLAKINPVGYWFESGREPLHPRKYRFPKIKSRSCAFGCIVDPSAHVIDRHVRLCHPIIRSAVPVAFAGVGFP